MVAPTLLSVQGSGQPAQWMVRGVLRLQPVRRWQLPSVFGRCSAEYGRLVLSQALPPSWVSPRACWSPAAALLGVAIGEGLLRRRRLRECGVARLEAGY